MSEIAYSVFRPAKEVKGAVAIVHGMAEHRKRYVGFAEYLAGRGYGVVTYDLPGHGESTDDTKGYFGKDGVNTLIDSVSGAIERSKQEFPGTTTILMGHSMGTMVSRCWIQNHDGEIDALILSGAPNWQSAGKMGISLGKVLRIFKGEKGLSPLMDSMVTGNFNKTIKDPETPVDWLSYNKENVKKYIEDPDCGFGFTIQGYIDELTLMGQMHDVARFRVSKPALPIRFIAGEEDPCIGGVNGLEDSIGTLKKAGYTEITSRLYPHMRHETLNETDHQTVFSDIADWLDEVTAQ
ncbi:MAG: alpha/beta hydrolase [Solobacterium sp.]|nr:alpha/beta hydrolase [Solobacterium sp.]